jgi:hypothetical protein
VDDGEVVEAGPGAGGDLGRRAGGQLHQALDGPDILGPLLLGEVSAVV